MTVFGKEAFKAGLEQLGYTVEDRGDQRLSFKYAIGAGRFEGKDVLVGIEVPADFDVTCPTGPHISPRLIPINTNGAGNDRAAESPNFGADWQYLSRPFSENQQGWNRVTRGVKAYLRHIKRILETL
jgi:hypothetical protein